MDTWKKSVLSAGKPVSVKFLLFRGGFWGGGGGKCRFYFYGRADFSENGLFWTFWGIFGDFSADPQKETLFETVLRFWGPEVAETPVSGGSSRKPNPHITRYSEGPKGGRRKGGRGRKLSHFSFCCAFRCCVVYSPCFPVWGEEKVMTIYDAGPLAAGPLYGLLRYGGMAEIVSR